MFIIIELIDMSFPKIVTDTEGWPIIFDDEDEVIEYSEQLHDPIIVRIA